MGHSLLSFHRVSGNAEWTLLTALVATIGLSSFGTPALAQDTPGWHVISGPYARVPADLEALPDGSLLAAAIDGLYRYDTEGRFWRKFALADSSVRAVKYRNGTYYAQIGTGINGEFASRFYRSTDGISWTAYPDPSFATDLLADFAVIDDGTLVVTGGQFGEPLVHEFDPVAQAWVTPEDAPDIGGGRSNFGVSKDNAVYVCGSPGADPDDRLIRGVARRAPDGTWTEIGKGLTISNPRGCFVASDGALYVGALFIGFRAVVARWREAEGWVPLEDGLGERPEDSGTLDAFAELPDGTIIVASESIHALAPGAGRWELLPLIMPYTGPDVLADLSLPTTDELTVAQGDLWAASRARSVIALGEIDSPNELPLQPPIDGVFRLSGGSAQAAWADESLRFGGTAYTGAGTDAGGITWT